MFAKDGRPIPYDTLLAQRDRLAEALRGLMEHHSSIDASAHYAARAKAKAALASLESEAQS